MTARLRSVARTAPRVLGLVRVSKERDGMISPEVQRVAIEDAAARRGYTVTGWMEGLDESGSQKRSAWWPRLDQAVAAVEAGEYDVVLVWKFSRVARHRLRWAVAIDRVEEAGGRIESATEDVDTTTSTGRFTRGMLAELQAFEAERIGEVWESVHDARVRAGRPATGKPKWGYAYDREQKLHVPDPVTGPVLADLYRRYVAGESFYSLVHWLNARGHVTTTGRAWTIPTLRTVLDTGFGTGRFIRHGQLVDGVHEPVVDEDTWAAYLEQRRDRRTISPRTRGSRSALGGLVRCGECEGPMSAGVYNGYPRLRCERRYRESLDACSTTYVSMTAVEQLLLVELAAQAERMREGTAAALAASARRATSVVEAERLGREVGRVEEALARLVVERLSAEPGMAAVYARAEHELQEKLAGLRPAHEDAVRAARRPVESVARAAADLVDRWERDSVEVRRKVLRDLLKEVRVTQRPSLVVEPVWAWDE
jgi:DNA invertase Pin-like site-specific DNA recombinase/predicted NAD-dependent protein-ADP-ribosyltransferase YbiA (DUF1768 family)